MATAPSLSSVRDDTFKRSLIESFRTLENQRLQPVKLTSLEDLELIGRLHRLSEPRDDGNLPIFLIRERNQNKTISRFTSRLKRSQIDLVEIAVV